MFAGSEIKVTYPGVVVLREYSTTPSGVLLDPWTLTVQGGQLGAGMKGHVLAVCALREDAKSEMSVRIKIDSESGDSRFRPSRNYVTLCVTIFLQCFLNQDLLRLCPREYPFSYL